MSDTPSCQPEAVLAALAAASGREPAFMHLLVADRCNHFCQHCYQVHGLKGEMSFEEISKLLRSFSDAGGFVVSISGGEPTLRPDLVDILERARELGLATVLYTNAFLVDDQLALRLAGARVWRVEVSLYSDVAAEHDAVTRVPGSWERTLGGIRRLRSAGLNVRIKYTVTRESTATHDRLVTLAQQLDCALLLADHVLAGEAGELASTRARQEPRIVAERQRRDEGTALLSAGPCSIGTSLAVRSDGILQPCTNVAVEMGRVGVDSDLIAVHRSSEVARFFRSLTWAHLHGCRDCDLRTVCSHCFASAATEAGDLLAPYRAACELAVARHALQRKGAEILPAAPGCGCARDPAVGPYRVESNGMLRPVPDVLAQDDEQLVARFPWIRPTRAALEAAALARRR